MLLQAIHSASSGSGSGNTADTMEKLVKQLAEISVNCDRLTEELVSVKDQIGKLRALREKHEASALAIAVRKVRDFPRLVVATTS